MSGKFLNVGDHVEPTLVKYNDFSARIAKKIVNAIENDELTTKEKTEEIEASINNVLALSAIITHESALKAKE